MLDLNKTQDESGNFMRQAFWLFVNFFLIIAAYYQIKPASRSLAIEFIGTDNLPYLWIGSATLLGLLMPCYQWLVNHTRRRTLNLYSLSLFIGLLAIFYPVLQSPGFNSTICFYFLADIFSVILVEQFWSLSNSVCSTERGKKWYGFIAAGGLSGGIAGGFIASWLIKSWSFSTTELLMVAIVFILVLLLLTAFFTPKGIYQEAHLKSPLAPVENQPSEESSSSLVRPRYLVFITLLLCFAQLVEPIVEYQFLKIVEFTYPLRDDRTAFISVLLGWLGVISLFINLFITPLVHRTLGVIAGLTIQPMCVFFSAVFFTLQANLWTASILKIADRGLSYSMNRASKELLYVPIPARQIYQLKAWIDMFGYRLFKLSGAILILVFTQWSSYLLNLQQFSYILIVTSVSWLLVIVLGLRKEYKQVLLNAKSTN